MPDFALDSYLLLERTEICTAVVRLERFFLKSGVMFRIEINLKINVVIGYYRELNWVQMH